MHSVSALFLTIKHIHTGLKRQEDKNAFIDGILEILIKEGYVTQEAYDDNCKKIALLADDVVRKRKTMEDVVDEIKNMFE